MLFEDLKSRKKKHFSSFSSSQCTSSATLIVWNAF